MRRGELFTRANEDGEAGLLVPAVGVGETGLSHPGKLAADVDAAILLPALQGVGDLLLSRVEGSDLLEPEGSVLCDLY